MVTKIRNILVGLNAAAAAKKWWWKIEENSLCFKSNKK
jgi:hypothetical protein